MSLHLVESARVANRVGNMKRLRLFQDVVVAVARIGMVAQPLRSARPPLFLDRFEDVRHVARVVAGAGHDVRPFDVGLTFVLPAEPEERCPEPEAYALRDDAARGAADNRAEDGARD